VVVQTQRVSRHPIYGKVIRRHRKFMAHDRTTNALLATWCASSRRGLPAVASAGLWTLSWSTSRHSALQATRSILRDGSQYQECEL
jgi:hypothetical protein